MTRSSDLLEMEVFEDVTTALAEKNKYHTSGRFPLPELWNFIEERNASVAAGVSHILNHLKTNKRNKGYIVEVLKLIHLCTKVAQ